MRQPDKETVRAFAHIAQNVPRVAKYFEECYQTELERLPVTTNNLGVAQGRCQILGEIHKLLRDAPQSAA